ncbi:MAG: hypothetical protein QMC89_00110 [Candidatus Hodarchaeaceae archaeon]|nr:hypothetical protein [Candidatus Hodarchaeaceae archaeon]
MSYDAAYVKILRPGEARASFICWRCTEGLPGDKLREVMPAQG